MAKPICVVKVDMTVDLGYGSRGINLHELNYAMGERMKDYHVFVVPAANNPDERIDPIQFQVFHEKDFTDIQYAELRKIIEDSLPKTTKNDSET